MTLFTIFSSLSLFSLTLAIRPSHEYHPQPNWEPLPERCKSEHDQIQYKQDNKINSSVLVIPGGLKPLGINVTVMVTEHSVYPCDSRSVIRQLSYSGSGEGQEAC